MAKAPTTKTVATLKHDEATRKNIPTAEYQSVLQKEGQSPVRVAYTRPDLVAAAREAGDADFDVRIACAFNYEAHATEFSKLGRIPVLKAAATEPCDQPLAAAITHMSRKTKTFRLCLASRWREALCLDEPTAPKANLTCFRPSSDSRTACIFPGEMGLEMSFPDLI